ncbi:MAG: hypothetical protein H6Q00_1643 [Holophagaceae bacterium]|nr:hypothetical protein [Holophagaceae bacterium]
MSNQIEEIKQNLARLQKQRHDFHTERARLVGLLQEAREECTRADKAVTNAEVGFKAACIGGSGNEADSRNILQKAKEEVELATLRTQAIQAALETHERDTNICGIDERIRTSTAMAWESIRDQEITKAVESAREALYRAFAAAQLGRGHAIWPEFIRQRVGITGLQSPPTDEMQALQAGMAKRYGLPF